MKFFLLSWVATTGYYVFIIETIPSGSPNILRSGIGLAASATLLSMVFGWLCFQSARKRGLLGTYKSKASHIAALFCHLLLAVLFLIQTLHYELPVSSVLASILLDFISWVQMAIYHEFRPLGYFGVLFFPHTIHQIFVFANTYCLFSAFWQLRKAKGLGSTPSVR